jgi:hypothetical protein
VAASAAQALIPPSLVLAGIAVGNGVEACLALLAGVLPDLSHVTVQSGRSVGALAWLAGKLEGQGIGVAYSSDLHGTSRGSDLVILEAPVPPLARDWFIADAVVVEIGAAARPPVSAEHIFADRPYSGEKDLEALLAGQLPLCQALSGLALIRVRGVRHGAADLVGHLYQEALRKGFGTPGPRR